MLTKFYTMDDLVGLAEDWQSNLHDTRGVNIRSLLYEGATDSLLFKAGSENGDSIFGDMGMSGVLNDHAFGQLAERVGAPSRRWLRNNEKCPDDLRETILNWKFENWPEAEYLLRQRTEGERNMIRAVLSSQYSVYDNFEFIEAIKDAVDEGDLDVHVWRPDVGDQFRAYIIVKGIDFGVEGHQWTGENPDTPLGDGGGNGGLKPAIYISNSEIGGGRVRITGGLYRSWCANGVIAGWKTEGNMAITHRFKSKAHMSVLVNEAIADGIKLSEKAAIAFLSKRAIFLKKTKLSSIVDKWANKYGLLLDTKETWNTAIKLHGDLHEQVSAAEVANQLTALRSDNADEQEAIERCAGHFIMAEVPWADRVDEVS